MNGLNEKVISLWKQEGVEFGKGVGTFIRKGNFTGESMAVEQQLQIQKGEHKSSPQSLEWLWSDSTECSKSEK